jgi:hypothetical protein
MQKLLYSKDFKSTREQGSIYIMTVFMVMALTLLSFSYWKMIEMSTQNIELKEGELKAMMAARGGIEDAAYELGAFHSWTLAQVSSQWNQKTADTFYKSTVAPVPLTHFDSPTTISVTVTGDPSTGTINISSSAEVFAFNRTFLKTFSAQAIRSSPNNEIHIVAIREN